MSYYDYTREKFIPFKADGWLTHSAVGMLSETLELIEAFYAKDRINLLEELGDLVFYLQTLTPADLSTVEADDRHVPAKSIIERALVVTSIIKSILIKGSDRDESLDNAVLDMTRDLRLIAEDSGIDWPAVFDANRAKLNFRHGEGKGYGGSLDEKVRKRSAERTIIGRFL